MPVTIGTLNSTIDVSEASTALDPRMVERIVAIVMARLKEEAAREARFAEDSTIPTRMSEPTTY